MRREPLTGNTGENFESHKPVHETTTDSCTGKNGTRATFETFLTGESRMVTASPPRAKLFHEEPEAGNLHIRDCEG